MVKRKMKQVFIVSLGCPKNFVDTEVMAGMLISNGYDLTFDADFADIMIINTCAFLPSAREECYAAIKEAGKWKRRRPGRRIAVTGCLIQWDKQRSFMARFPMVDVWNGVDNPHGIAELLTNGGAKLAGEASPPTFLYDENTPRLQLTLPHVAYLKVAEGCDNRCSYCSIPNIRGNLRSRTIDSCIVEAQNLLAAGVKEMVLIAQDITAFGQDNGRGEDFAALLARIDALEGDFWVRLLYTHPAHYTDAAIGEIANSQHVVPYLDMPLQHIADGVLARMGRKIDGRATRDLLAKLRKRIPNLALRTTFITGFPGESEDDFKELYDFVGEFRFDRLGVFAYAAEPNTPASAMPEQIPGRLAEERADSIMQMQADISLENNKALIGKKMRVLVDVAERHEAVGRSYLDAPEIDNYIIVDGNGLDEGEFLEVEITDADTYDLYAKPMKERK